MLVCIRVSILPVKKKSKAFNNKKTLTCLKKLVLIGRFPVFKILWIQNQSVKLQGFNYKHKHRILL